MIGTWEVVIATNEGAVLGLFTRTPEARNWITYFQMFLFSPWQFHSSFCRLGGNRWILGSH
jgi:hypothetical protein